MNLLNMILPVLLGGLLNGENKPSPLWRQLTGRALLLAGFCFAGYFIYLLLIPHLGVPISGLIISFVLSATGAVLFLYKKSRGASPIESTKNILAEAKAGLENINMTQEFQKHKDKIAVAAVAISVIAAFFYARKDGHNAK